MQRVFPRSAMDTMYLGEIPVLTYRIDYPVFQSNCNPGAVRAINEYYKTMAEEKERYCRQTLYLQAAEGAKYIQDNIPPYAAYEFILTYHVAYNEGCILSLYMDEYTFQGGAHGSTLRTSQTWNFLTGKQIFLKELCRIYPSMSLGEKNILSAVRQYIQKGIGLATENYFEDYSSLLVEKWNPDSFYLEPDSLVIYYQQYDIAPYSAGIPEFRLPRKL